MASEPVTPADARAAEQTIAEKISQAIDYDESQHDWFEPTPQSGWIHGCCDCGLAHEIDMQVEHGRIQLRFRRSEEATAHLLASGREFPLHGLLIQATERERGLKTQLTLAEAAREEATKERDALEQELRQGWWTSHGCPVSALYGDDGEFQCGACGIDFKREPISALRDKVYARRLAVAGAALRAKIDACDRCDDQIATKCLCEGCQRYDRHDSVLTRLAGE